MKTQENKENLSKKLWDKISPIKMVGSKKGFL